MASKNGFASMRIDREVSQTRSTKFSSSAMQIMKNSFHLQVETRIQEHPPGMRARNASVELICCVSDNNFDSTNIECKPQGLFGQISAQN
jgi:hypothetical protein